MRKTDHNQMARALREIDEQVSFPDLHHFSDRDKFQTEPKTLGWFCEYCDPKEYLGKENQQTIQRAYYFAEMVKLGMPRIEALTDAWSRYPVVTR